MSSRSLFAAFALVATCLAPSLALAQLPATGIGLTIGGDTVQNATPLYINRAQCRAKWKFEVTLQPAGSGTGTTQIPVVEMWVGKNIDCSTVDNRSALNNNKAPCWLVHTKTNIALNASTDFNVDGDDIFDTPGDDHEGCDEVTGTTYKVAFVALDQNTREGTEAPARLTTVQPLDASFLLYGAIPDSPDDVRGRSGQASLGASWDGVNAGPITNYRIYMDTGTGGQASMNDAAVEGDADAGMATASCGSGKLVAGGPIPGKGDENIFSSGILSGTSGSIGDLDSKGVEIGDTVAIAVVTRDAAGNNSRLSEVVCVERVETSGFWEQCEADANCKDGFDECSATPWRSAGAPLSALVIGAATLAFVRRRRRNV